MSGGHDSEGTPGTIAVVGTGTGVGKTVVTAGVVGWLRAAGVDARAVKPVQTGHPPDDDAGFVAAACGDDRAATCLRRLEPPLAPRVAADRVGRPLDYGAIREEVRVAVEACEVGVVEGIGGLRVPLAGDREVVDLVADLGCPVLLVARPALGTLNHTALSVETLARRGVEVHAVVLADYGGETVAERTNPGELERMTGIPVYTLPTLDLDAPADAVEGVREHLPMDAIPVPEFAVETTDAGAPGE